METTDRETIHKFVDQNTTAEARVNTNEARCYHGLKRIHEKVCHSQRESVDGDVHTNGIESFWARVKRADQGTYHWWRRQHWHLYIQELVWKHNAQGMGVLDQVVLDLGGGWPGEWCECPPCSPPDDPPRWYRIFRAS